VVDTGDHKEQHGRLNGDPSAFFDSNRDKAQDFTRDFILYWMQNNQHPMFTNLYYQFTTCLAHIRGPKVNDWVNEVIRAVRKKLEDYQYFCTDEKLWKDFRECLRIMFINSTAIKKAEAKLVNLGLKDNDADTYIMCFETLLRCTGYN
jgi:hypothetical protein